MSYYTAKSEDCSKGESMDNVRDILNNKLRSLNLYEDHESLNDSIADLNDALNKLTEQERMIEVVETLMMTSPDDNIVELRKQLFTTVKLVHGDELEEIEKMYKERCSEEDQYDTSVYRSGSVNFKSVNVASHSHGLIAQPVQTINPKFVIDPYDVMHKVEVKRSIWKRAKDLIQKRKKKNG